MFIEIPVQDNSIFVFSLAHLIEIILLHSSFSSKAIMRILHYFGILLPMEYPPGGSRLRNNLFRTLFQSFHSCVFRFLMNLKNKPNLIFEFRICIEIPVDKV